MAQPRRLEKLSHHLQGSVKVATAAEDYSSAAAALIVQFVATLMNHSRYRKNQVWNVACVT
jgi:hypothetical protein